MEKQSIEEGVLPDREGGKWNTKMGVFVQELKMVSHIAAPMVTVTLLQYMLQVVSIMMVGHLGQLALSSVAIATSLTNVTGFSLLVSLIKYTSYSFEHFCVY